MRIVIISGTAPPEPLTASRINWDVASHMASEGNEVWLISPKPSRPLGVKYPATRGIQINPVSPNFSHIYLDSFTYPEYNLFLRAWESLDFGIRSTRYVNRIIKDYDLIYHSSWPFFSQLAVVILRKKKKLPLIMNIQDLYPESFFTKISSRAILRIFKPLFLIDKIIADRSSHITVISESLKEAYINKRKIPESKVSVIQNWQDAGEFVTNSFSKGEILQKYGIRGAEGRFIYMYLGNIGPVAGVDKILTSFASLDQEGSFLIIAGSGTAREKCRLLALKLKIVNSAFIEVPSGLQHVAGIQSIADVLLLPISADAASSSIPSKLIAYMFSGKPVITSADINSETGLTVTASGCGWITGTNSDSDWTGLMELARNTPQTVRNTMGQSGMEYAIRNFSKTEGLKKISRLISSIKMN